MGTRDQQKLIVKLARIGKMDGDSGLRVAVNEAVKMSVDLDFNEKPYFRSAVWEATWKNHESCVKLLVEKKATVDFKDYQGRTPLHEAAYYGHFSLCEFFLEKGADIDNADIFGHTPLFRAVEAGRHAVVELLIEKKASTNLLDGDDITVQHLAAFQGMPQMSDWLVFNGAYRNRYAMVEGSKISMHREEERPPLTTRSHASEGGEEEPSAAAAASVPSEVPPTPAAAAPAAE